MVLLIRRAVSIVSPQKMMLIGMVVAILVVAPWGFATVKSATISLTTGLRKINVTSREEIYRGSRSLEVTPAPLPDRPDDPTLVILPASEFDNGTIELELMGEVAPGADTGARGFVGVAFHVSQDTTGFDMFYLRPTNGRADDQARRNHSVQYVSSPDFGWQRLRREEPGVYESYADIQPGVWIRTKIVVLGEKAQLYLNNAKQPCLIINNLKRKGQRGPVALWAGPGTIAHFRGVRLIRP